MKTNLIIFVACTFFVFGLSNFGFADTFDLTIDELHRAWEDVDEIEVPAGVHEFNITNETGEVWKVFKIRVKEGYIKYPSYEGDGSAIYAAPGAIEPGEEVFPRNIEVLDVNVASNHFFHPDIFPRPYPPMNFSIEAGGAENITLQMTPGISSIHVPIRWCAVQGSQTANSDTDSVILASAQRTTDETLFPGAVIGLRSAMPWQVQESAHFPIINDPNPSPGVEGDMLYGSDEVHDAIASCKAAWNDIEMQASTAGEFVNVEGPIGIIIGRFVNNEGNGVLTGGMASGFTEGPLPDACLNPYLFSANLGDNSYLIVAEDSLNHLLAHEFGHVVSLGHGNGVDDDNDGLYDGIAACWDPDEEPGAPPRSFMSPIPNTVITELQEKTARAVANVTSGATKDPPRELINGDTVSDSRVDTVHDVTDDSVDIVSVAITENTVTGETFFSHELFGIRPFPPNHQYLLFADLDGSPSTGGSPSNLGLPTTFQGAELVTRVLVTTHPEFGEEQVILTVWRFQAGSFVDATDLTTMRADVTTSVDAHSGIPLFDVVSVQMPRTLMGQASVPISIQAIAQQLDTGQLDRLPDGPATDAGEGIYLVPPEFPECTVAPFVVNPGEEPPIVMQIRPGTMVNVEANRLIPNKRARVMLGDQPVATGPIDNEGNVEISFRVPVTTKGGPHLVTVGVMDTALTADCMTEVGEPPLVIITPEASRNDVGVDHTVTATVRDEAGDPQPGVLVEFSVGAGPNAGASGVCTSNADCTTDANGMVLFTYKGSGGLGVDQIGASFVDEDGNGFASNTALKFWDVDCNQNDIADTCDINCDGFGGLCGEGYVGFCGQSADDNGDGVPDECNEPKYRYSAKMVCGLQKDPEGLRLAPGRYATAINILNPNDRTARFGKTLSLTFPSDGDEPGEVLSLGRDELAPGEAVEVDCIDVQRQLFPNGLPSSYLKGFVVLRSDLSLDVTAVYSASGLVHETEGCGRDAGCCNHGGKHHSQRDHGCHDQKHDRCQGSGGRDAGCCNHGGKHHSQRDHGCHDQKHDRCQGSGCKETQHGTISIDVEDIRERLIERRPPQKPTCPDLVVRDIDRPAVRCPTGAGSCVTTARFTISNIGDADAGAFDLRTAFDPKQSVTVSTHVPGGLDTGNSSVLSVTTPPGGNCYDPDCTIRAFVDSGQDIKECVEDNNTREETSQG